VKSIEDLADLASDELIEFLGADIVSEKEANNIIMQARRQAGWFDED